MHKKKLLRPLLEKMHLVDLASDAAHVIKLLGTYHARLNASWMLRSKPAEDQNKMVERSESIADLTPIDYGDNRVRNPSFEIKEESDNYKDLLEWIQNPQVIETTTNI